MADLKHDEKAVTTERASMSEDSEKAVVVEHAENLTDLEDPDAGKTPEERAAIVSVTCIAVAEQEA